MKLSLREFWTVFHGMVVGAVYLLAFAGGLSALWSLRTRLETDEGIRKSVRQLRVGTWAMAVVCWLTVISGTWIVYPWYRAKTPDSPRTHLLSDPEKAAWHTFGMEWKEHVAWLAPFLATAAAAIVSAYGADLARRHDLRRATLVVFCVAFAAAGVAGVFGAFINKIAPVL